MMPRSIAASRDRVWNRMAGTTADEGHRRANRVQKKRAGDPVGHQCFYKFGIQEVFDPRRRLSWIENRMPPMVVNSFGVLDKGHIVEGLFACQGPGDQ